MSTQELLTQAQSELAELVAQFTPLTQEEIDALPQEDADALAALALRIAEIEAQIATLMHKLDLENRIAALGEIGPLVAHYFGSAPEAQRRADDAWNPCAFCADHIETNFGWHFPLLQKPTLTQLEQIKLDLEA
jgi:hypothetical protein